VGVEGEGGVYLLPNLDFVIVSSRTEQRLSRMEIDSPNRSIVFLEPVYEDSHLKVP
jgi:hypothetical protein